MKKNLLLSTPFIIALIASSAIAAKPVPPKHRISEEKAQSVALKTAPGTVESHELEHENGKWVYSFDIRGNDKQIHEVQVDARSGAVVSSKIESPDQEAKEAAAESKR